MSTGNRSRAASPSLSPDQVSPVVQSPAKSPVEHQSAALSPRSGSVGSSEDPQHQQQHLTPTDSVNAPGSEQDELLPLLLRALVTTKEAGVVIGKGGKNVSEIRELSGAKVTVSEMVPGAVERVLTVTGPLDTVAKAFALAAHKFLEQCPDGNEENIGVRSTAIRLLLPHSRMGSVIGKGGSKIRDIQEESGARLMASADKLPSSTERVVTVTGVPDSIHIAVYHIGEIFRRFPDRTPGYQPYKPMARFEGTAVSMQGGDLYGGAFAGSPHQQAPIAPQFVGGYVGQVGPPGPYVNCGGGPPLGGGGGTTAGVGGAVAGAGAARALPPGAQVQQIFIPNDMVGCIIGRQGSSINEIRNLSKTHIKIGEPYPGKNERMVTITGTPQHNQVAIYLLYKKLESEKQRTMSSNLSGGILGDSSIGIPSPGGVAGSYYGGEMINSSSPVQHDDRGPPVPYQ